MSIAVSNAGQAIPDGAAQYLVDGQASDGAWALFGDTDAGAGDTNTTALVIQALVAAGIRDGIDDALTYLHNVQNDDGGFPYQSPSDYGTDTDANSTAVVLQALQAAGEALDDWAPGGMDPLAALTSLHDPTTGGFVWQAAVPGPNVLATAQAIPALTHQTFTYLPVAGTMETVEVTASEPVATLPASGASLLLPAVLIGSGIAAAGTGLLLRWFRRQQHSV